ncbi:hypothetical protein Scep_019783 [Stephania cephalantha]|uniref:Uncharacterized protein n=1 Tax=Stephania cephalantha TaxID=152367 RepID=A0AAP0IBB2_9MAGN
MAQSHERNMARILELMQQGNTGPAERAPKRHGANPLLSPIHEDQHMEEGADSAMATAASAVPVVDGDPKAFRRDKIHKEFMKYDVPHFMESRIPLRQRHGY